MKLKNTLFVYIIFIKALTHLNSQSIQELNKLREEYENKIKNESLYEVQDQNSGKSIDIENMSSPEKINIINQNFLEAENSKNENILKHFGYNFFTKRDTVSFWENFPIPADYILGPGDEIVISLWGETQISNNYTILKDGKIYDDKVGLLYLSGKTVEQAKQYLKNKFGTIYSTLSNNKPSTFIDISIGNLKSINVNFVGEVNFPGVYPIHPFSNLINGLIQAGGIDTSGTLREIKIKRNNQKIINIDLYNFFIEGSINSDIQLRDQDIVIVPPRKSKVFVDSSIVRPGIYESLESESVLDIINYAGGPNYDFSGIVVVRSILPANLRKDGQIYKSYYTEFKNIKNIKIIPGDKIILNKIMDQISNVEIIGQVKMPGKYFFEKGMTLKDLLDLSSGIDDETYWKSIYHEQAEIIRRKPNERYDQVLSFNLSKVKDDSLDIPLQNLDRVVIHANLNFFEKEPVKIQGEINIPGDYPLITDNESLESIIIRAGGFTNKAFKRGIEVYRDSLSVAWKNLTLPLSPGDSIIVNEKTRTIRVSGEVYNPSLIEFDKRRSLNEYIDLAGGITKNGDKNDIIIIFSNGEVVPKKRFKRILIDDGSTIIVNKKDVVESFDTSEFVNNTISLLSSLITILVLSQQLSGN